MIEQSQNAGFIYIWFNRETKMYYIGSHLGTIDDGYIGSGIYFSRAYKQSPQKFKRRILELVPSKDDILIRENFWLNKIAPHELGTKYYNLKNVAEGGNIFSNLSEEKKDNHRRLASLNSRKFWDNITKEDLVERQNRARNIVKISDQSYRQSDAFKNSHKKFKEENHFFGKKHTPEAKEKMRLAKLGKKRMTNVR